MSASEDTEKMECVLEFVAREFTKHSGPQSDAKERATFARDLHAAALRYARAYYVQAKEFGLIPEYERTTCSSRWGQYKCDRLSGHDGDHYTEGRFTSWPHSADNRVIDSVDGISGVWRGYIDSKCENCGFDFQAHLESKEYRCPTT